MKVFEKGQRVIYTGDSTGPQGIVTEHFCAYGDHFVRVLLDGGNHERDFSEELVEPVKGDEVEDLTLLAEMLNRARLQVKPVKAHVARQNLYNRIGEVMVETLMVLLEDVADVPEVYDAVVFDGKTVREALALVEDGED